MPNLFNPNILLEGDLIDNYYLNHLKFNLVRKTDLIDLNPDLKIKRAVDNLYLYYRLESNNQEHLVVLRLEKEKIYNKTYYKINKSYSFQKQMGYGTILYEYALCYCPYPIISDKNQTKPGSCDLWKKLQSLQSTSPYAIYVFNTKKNWIKLYETRNYKDHDIWGLSQNTIDTFFLQSMFSENYIDDDIDSDEYEIEDPTFADFENNFSGINSGIRDFVSNAKNNISDREHIRLIGRLKK